MTSAMKRFAAESERKGDSWNYYEWTGSDTSGIR